MVGLLRQLWRPSCSAAAPGAACSGLLHSLCFYLEPATYLVPGTCPVPAAYLVSPPIAELEGRVCQPHALFQPHASCVLGAELEDGVVLEPEDEAPAEGDVPAAPAVEEEGLPASAGSKVTGGEQGPSFLLAGCCSCGHRLMLQ